MQNDREHYAAYREYYRLKAAKRRKSHKAQIAAYMKGYHVRYHESVSGRAYRLVSTARARAARDGLQFDLTRAWVARRLAAGRCELTGLPFDMRAGKGSGPLLPFSPSLDRRNPKLGYTKRNTRVVCMIANAALSSWGAKAVTRFAKAWLAR